MPGMQLILHDPGQAVVPDSPMGVPLSDQHAWRGHHSSQYDTVTQQECGASRHGSNQNHNPSVTTSTHPRIQQQGKRAKARHTDCRASVMDRRLPWFFQVQQPLMSLSLDPLRRPPTYPPPVSQAHYRLHDTLLFSAAPGLYAYPASALASVSQTVDQMQGGSSRHALAGGAYACMGLLQKNGGLVLAGPMPGPYGNHQQQQQQLLLAGQHFHHSSAPYPGKFNQYPYL
ncbi:hypothetical protein NHX12_013257 [Muraenolepis orangiensis]|uniref:Uncharacterized protein n=1 Tax=Muraenolepis orangiensis TaxID=630683 RepID=A0A9Q0DH35_9TELE|nr:hypothetical protein NHX12_013257 [Muraenolepis orangiensis]